jgi:protein TonB
MAVNRFLVVSVGAHVVLGVVLGAVHAEKRRETVAIAFRDTKKAPPPPPPPALPPDLKPPPAAPRAMRAKTAPPDATKPAPAAAQAAAVDSLPDFGLSLTGGGSGGLAIPVGGRASREAPAAPMAAKTLSRGPAKADDCSDPPAKPRPLTRSTPAYTAEARAAGVSGKVRIEITVDERGRVVAARVLQGLGHGLDEAALAAAREMTFEPATRCGRPSAATFKIGFTFAPSSSP